MPEIPFDLLNQLSDLIAFDSTPADMLKSMYDTGASSGSASVDLADGILGGSAAGNSKYYGTDPAGVLGFNSLPSSGASLATNETKTVGAGKDYATIQAAINYFKGKIVYGICTIEVDAGTYAENIVFSDILVMPGSTLWLKGDTRVLAGLTYVDHAFGANSEGRGYGGATDAACALANSGNDITVTVTGGDPDFDADGWVNGDKLLVYDNAKAITEKTITGTNNKTITLTVAAPTVGNTGTAICLCPNRVIAKANGHIIHTLIPGVKVTGFYLKSSSSFVTIICVLNPHATLDLGNVATYKGGSSLDIYGGVNYFLGCISFWDSGNYGVYSKASMPCDLSYVTVIKSASTGFYNDGASNIYSYKGKAVGCVKGFSVYLNSPMQSAECSTVINTTGFYASSSGWLAALSCLARCSGNTANSAIDALLGSYVYLT